MSVKKLHLVSLEGSAPISKYHWVRVLWDILGSDIEGSRDLFHRLVPEFSSDEILEVHVASYNKLGVGIRPFIVFYLDWNQHLYVDFVLINPDEVLSWTFTQALKYSNTACPGFQKENYPEYRYIPFVKLVDVQGILEKQHPLVQRLVPYRVVIPAYDFTVPFVALPALFPCLKNINICEDLRELRSRVREFYAGLNGAPDFKDIDLLRNCAALADYRVYDDDGARHSFVDLMIAKESDLDSYAFKLKVQRDSW